MKKIYLLYLSLLSPILLLAQTFQEMETYVQQHKSDKSVFIGLQNYKIQNPNYVELKSLFKQIDRSVKKTNEGKFFERYLEALKQTSIGSKSPGITQFDLEGLPVSIVDFRGKYLLLNFWASWNQPSVDTTLRMKEWYTNFAGEHFDVLNISFDRDFDEWNNAVQKDSIPGIHISDLQGTNNYANVIFGVKVTPQNILIDPQGIVIARNIYGKELESKIKELVYSK